MRRQKVYHPPRPPKPAPPAPVAVERGDEVYVRHQARGVMRVTVLCCGKDGFQGTEEGGNRVKVRHSAYLRHKARAIHEFRQIDQGEDGVIIENQHGRRRFLRGEVPYARDPEQEAFGDQGGLAGLDDPLMRDLDELESLTKAFIPVRPLPPLHVLMKAGLQDEDEDHRHDGIRRSLRREALAHQDHLRNHDRRTGRR